jgi:hypothetical protein
LAAHARSTATGPASLGTGTTCRPGRTVARGVEGAAGHARQGCHARANQRYAEDGSSAKPPTSAATLLPSQRKQIH